MSAPASSLSRHKEIFFAAGEIVDAGERSRFIAHACGDDAELRARIEAMLGTETVKDGFLEPDETLSHAAAAPGAGEKVGYFGDYVLLDEIAHGSSGVVFRARQVSLDRVVALKMLRDRPLLTTEHDTRRLRAEATAAASLDHPNIVPIYEVGAHEGQPYFSMKLVEGGTLQFRMAEYQADPRKAASLMAKVAHAVHHAHIKGILHRDLKPGNILLDAAGEPHITDFGLARKMGLETGLTMTGMAMGTPHYMSPEQARGGGRELTPATDIYSLGSILYELVEGRRTFDSEDLIELLRQVAEKSPPVPRTPHRGLAAVMMKSLEKSPAARYATAADFAADLERWLDGKTSAPPRGPVPWGKAALAAAACAAVAFALHTGLPVHGHGHVVTTAEDELDPPGIPGSGVSLREAVRDAAPGARVTFDPSVFGKAGKITLDAARGAVEIEKNLELDASALPLGITLHSPKGGCRKLTIKAGAVVGVKRVTFTAENLAPAIGSGHGGAIYNEGTLTLYDCRFIKNGGGANGGAIFTAGSLIMERCIFEGNVSRFVGGAIYVKASAIPVRAIHCLFKGNVAHGNGGGALFVGRASTAGQVALDHCTITENGATASQYREHVEVPDRGAGGGIRVEAGSVDLTHCIIAGNRAVIAGTENLSGELRQTGVNFIGGDPKDAPAGLGASVK